MSRLLQTCPNFGSQKEHTSASVLCTHHSRAVGYLNQMVSQTQRLQQPMTSNDQNHPKWSAQDVWLRPSSQRSTSKVRQFSVKDGELKAELALESDKREKLGIKGITVFLCSHILLNNQDWSSREPTPTSDLQGIYITTHGGFSFQPSKSDARMRIKLQCREVEQPRHTQ